MKNLSIPVSEEEVEKFLVAFENKFGVEIERYLDIAPIYSFADMFMGIKEMRVLYQNCKNFSEFHDIYWDKLDEHTKQQERYKNYKKNNES